MALLINYMFFFSTEVTSSNISSDNPLFQRTKKAYELIADKVFGNVLEIGSGEGYGIEIILQKNDSINFTAIDKSNYPIKKLSKKFPNITVLKQKAPSLSKIPSHSQDFIIAFQVIEHIKNDSAFLNEIKRILKPNGTLFLTTPNKEHTIARNPWHYREYEFMELENLIRTFFNSYKIHGISANQNALNYYTENKKSVEKILQWDILKLEKIAPNFLLKIPYELLNRYNRKKIHKQNQKLVNQISSDDYFVNENKESYKDFLDFFCIIN